MVEVVVVFHYSHNLIVLRIQHQQFQLLSLIGNDEKTGALRISSATIADGATADFAVQGYNGTTAAAIVSSVKTVLSWNTQGQARSPVIHKARLYWITQK